MMKNIISLILYLCVSIILFSCRDHKIEEKKLDQTDSIIIIKKSLQIILDKKILPKEYYNQPLKILITNKNLNSGAEIKVNGVKSILLSKDTNVKKLLKGMDIFKPIPLFEIIDLKTDKGLFHIDIILRATGLYYQMSFKRNKNQEWVIIKITEGNI